MFRRGRTKSAARAICLLAVGLAALAAAQPPAGPLPPRSLAETPAMLEAKSVAESTARAPRELLTEAERSGFVRTGDYDECIRLYRALERQSPYARLQKMGETAEGRPLYLFIVSKDRAFTPQAARRTGKAVVLLQNGIHPGENGGKDAAVMLLRDVLATKTHARWLDHVVLLSIPVFNADGHEHASPYNRINENGPAEMGFRVTAQRLNLNRDYLKADTPEMRAWLRSYNSWLPDLLIDNHVTDGSDNQYDVTIATHTEQDIAPPVGQWVKEEYLPRLEREMTRRGHILGWYIEGGSQQTATVMTASPRYSTGYAAAQNRAALLVETHSLKSFRTRVWSHYDIMLASVDAVAATAASLVAAGRDADLTMERLAPGTGVFLAGTPDGSGEPYTSRQLESETYPSAAAGGPVVRYTERTKDVEMRLVRTLKPRIEPPAPAGYLIPAAYSQIADLLKLHGVRVERLATQWKGEAETVRFENVTFAQQPFEGRFQVTGFQTRKEMGPRAAPAGSYWVPAAQRAGKAAMHMLEPEAPDSLLRWNFFPSIFEQKEYFSAYVFAPYADEMLRASPALAAELDAKKLDGRGRLRWLYERSPYFEPGKDVYPILRLSAPPASAPAPVPGTPSPRGSAPSAPGK